MEKDGKERKGKESIERRGEVRTVSKEKKGK